MTVTGAIVGSYQILERLGTGGMGEVYRARHLHLDRQAAIKMLLMELSQDREAVDRFFAEAQATSLIHHPGIVEIFDCNVHESGRVFLVMELLEGETLAERMRRDPDLGRDLPLVLGIADQIADALGAAHARGIVHRDLKPENVFLVKPPASQAGGVPRVKVLDFGIAKLLNSRGGSGRMSEAHTLADRVLGTPAYMSPEQCRDARSVDHRTDVYSLGCVLFEMIAGHLPFQASTFGELVAAQLWETPPALPGPASKLVARMLAKDPSWRLQDMGQVRSEIARVLRRARSQAGAGGLADLRLRWESFWNERMSAWLPPRARPAGRWMGSLLSSRRQLVGIGVGWALIVSVVAVLALRERGAPAQPAAAPAAARVKGADQGSAFRGPPAEGMRPPALPPLPDPPAPTAPAAGSSMIVAAEPDEGVATEDAEPPVVRSAPRARAAVTKASNARATAARPPRPSSVPEPVELTDDQRKL